MSRALRIVTLSGVAVARGFCLFLAATVLAQAPVDLSKLRPDAQTAFKLWRDGDPTLESDAGVVAREELDRRIKLSSDDVQKVIVAKRAVANTVAETDRSALTRLEKASDGPDVDTWKASIKAQQTQVGEDISLLNRNIEVFAADRDRGIQQVKTAIERERAALEAVRVLLAEEQKSLTAIQDTGRSGAGFRSTVVENYAGLVAGSAQDVRRLERESDLWQAYYRALPQAAELRVTKTTSSAPAEESIRPATAIQAGTPTISTPGLKPAPAEGGSVVRGPEPPASRPAVSPSVSTAAPRASYTTDPSRWIGEWLYPAVNGMFYGDEPQSAELIVTELNGRLNGTLGARFKIPRGISRDPVLRLEFTGLVSATRTQKLAVTGPGDLRGSLELLPGPAGNLIEVNWQIEPLGRALSKVRQGDMVLLKK